MLIRLIAPILVFALSAMTAVAEVRTTSLDEIREQQTAIRTEVLARTGQYAELRGDRRNKLVELQDKVLALIDGKQSVKELNEREKTDVFNALEWISAIVTGQHDGRVICERTRPAGSHRVQRVCFTVAELRDQREGAGKMLAERPLCWDGCPR